MTSSPAFPGQMPWDDTRTAATVEFTEQDLVTLDMALSDVLFFYGETGTPTNPVRERISAMWQRLAKLHTDNMNTANEERRYRLAFVSSLRDLCYNATRPTSLDFDPKTVQRAETILDTPVDTLADMVDMSDTVLGNWRSIAAALVH